MLRATGPMIALLLLLVIGCGNKPVTQTEQVYLTPPEHLMTIREAWIPQQKRPTNEELLMWGLDMYYKVRAHNEDKQAMQKWANGLPGLDTKGD